MDKKKLALTMAVATTLTVSSVSSSLPSIVYAQENENEENVVENGLKETTLPEVQSTDMIEGVTEDIEDVVNTTDEKTTLPVTSEEKQEIQIEITSDDMQGGIAIENAIQRLNITNLDEVKSLTVTTAIGAYLSPADNAYITKNFTSLEKLDESECDCSSRLLHENYITAAMGGVDAEIPYKEFGGLSGFTSLKELSMPKCTQVINSYVGNEFKGIENTGLTSISIPDGVLVIENGAFSSNVNLTGDIIIPNSVVLVGNNAFGLKKSTKCGKLILGHSIRHINNNAFMNRLFQGDLVLPDSIQKVGDGVFTAGSFEGGTWKIGTGEIAFGTGLSGICSGNTGEFTISSNWTLNSYSFKANTFNKIIFEEGRRNTGTGVINSSKNVTEVVLPSTLQIIDNYSFGHCDSLSIINLPEGLTTIGKFALAANASLKSIVLPSSIKSIDNQSFEDTSFNGIFIPKGIEKIGTRAFRVSQKNEPNESQKIIYVEDSTVLEKINAPLSDWDKIYRPKVNTVAVTNGGVFPSDVTFEYGKFTTPIKEGYVFVGWYDNEDFNGVAATTPEVNKTYFAKWKEKKETNISFKDDFKLDKTYDGKGVSISKNDYTLTDGAGEVSFSYQVKNGDTWVDVNEAPTNAGTYRVKATVAENDNYKGAETDWKEFTIRKAKPTYTLPNDLIVGKGKELATVALPSGFTWADEAQTADELGTHEFNAIYTPEDTVNYETVEVMIAVEVVPNTSLINHAPEIDVSDKTLTVGDVFDPMENVVVKDKEDNVNDLVVDVTHNVDTNKAGVYEVTYKVTDSEGASTVKTNYVTVNPKLETLNEVPTISASDKTLTVGDKFEPLKDVAAMDKEDGTLTDKIEVLKNTVDTSKAGVYEVTYKVTDSNGATTTKTITVIVKEKNVVPITPERPEDTDKTDTAQTGDMTNLGVFASMLTASSTALAVLLGKHRKSNKR